LGNFLKALRGRVDPTYDQGSEMAREARNQIPDAQTELAELRIDQVRDQGGLAKERAEAIQKRLVELEAVRSAFRRKDK